MSYKEKSIATSLVILVYIWGSYLIDLIALKDQGALTVDAVNALLLAVVIKTVILEVFLQAVVAIIDHKDANSIDDERDKLIRLKSNNHAYLLLSIGVFFAVSNTVFPFEVVSFKQLTNDYNVIHIIMLFALIAEFIRLSSTLYYYRRGF